MIDLAALPPFARELEEYIGLPATLALCAAYGGLSLWIPRTLPPDSALPLEIGSEPARKLVAIYGGCRIEPPRLAALATAKRDALIASDAAAGEGLPVLALRYRLTVRHVRRILTQRREPRQASA